jgi:hypothetical protein
MCRGARGRTVVGMTTKRFSKLIAALFCAALVWPAAGHAADRTKTIKIFSKTVALTVTHPDGTVVDHPPFPDMQPGDVLDVYSLDFRGNHKHHSKHFVGSDHVRCVFGAGEPDCVSHVALGGSMLIFSGNPGTLVGGLGRFQGATGRVISSKEVRGGNDVVAKIKLAKHHP